MFTNKEDERWLIALAAGVTGFFALGVTWGFLEPKVPCCKCPAERGAETMKDPLKKNWRKCRIRNCRYLNFCELCKRDIKAGEQYFDGGYGRRAHVECVKSSEFLAAHQMVEFPE
jgi:hypothetical protein